ncbi:hypothetical protein GJAV_G00271090 [Gymnothorax javanicus]|nr:hypothetical protein GJAV_G00271090 [Gymnothorax javanicus]
METATKGKAKRRHLSAGESLELSQSFGGPLAQPYSVCRSSLDPSRGLYPRSPTKRGRRAVDGGSPQKPITQFFPVKSVLSSSPQKKAIKEEELPCMEAELQAADDDPFEGLTDSMFMDDDELTGGGSESAAAFSIKQEDSAASCFVKQEDLSATQGGAGGCRSWGCQARNIPFGTVPTLTTGSWGVGAGWAEPRGQLGDLPAEILRVVFGHLPAGDLYRHISLVCRRWRDIVYDPLFVPWKKLYYQYQKREKTAVQHVESILTENHITAREDECILNMLRYMSQFKPSRGPGLYETPPARPARDPGGSEPVVSHGADAGSGGGVRDVQDLATRLIGSGCLLVPGGVSEFLSCVAVLLLAMRQQGIKMSSRCHYNVFYVLHLMENSPPPAVQGGAVFQVTHEQQQILNHNIQPGQVVKIMAFAGTGKTSTLVQYARHRPHLRFLYVAFNKSTAIEAQQRFPGNVDCRTIHSMAFAAVGKSYQHLKKLGSNIYPFSVAWVLPKGLGGFVNAKVVTQTINAFFASADTHITIDHVPDEYKNTNGQMKRPSDTEKQTFAREAQKIWDRMTQLAKTKETAYHMTHDGYLKLWQLQKPNLYNYDAIFIDEAQDCTPAIMDILLRQACGKILVGDPHQQIYTFRGAVNALQEAPHSHLYYLTQSFRFGSEISYIGATILWYSKGVTKMLVGGSQSGDVRGEEDFGAVLGLEQDRAHRQGSVAYLSRCNVTVFDQAVHLTSRANPPKIHIVGGVDNFGLQKILDIWVLMQPESDRIQKNLTIGDFFIKRFCKESMGGYAGLKKYAVHSEDRELEAKLAVVEKYNHRIPKLVDRIYSCSVSSPHSADYVLGTVHKAKGQEFDMVVVTDDFVKMHCAGHNRQRLYGPNRREDGSLNVPEDEWNLLYVAVTRAKKKLVITKTIQNILTMAKEYFLRPVLTSSLLREGRPPGCSIEECHNHLLEDSALSMCQAPVRYTDSSELGKPLCVTCVEQRVGHMVYLLASPEQVKATPYTLERVEFPINVAMLMALI